MGTGWRAREEAWMGEWGVPRRQAGQILGRRESGLCPSGRGRSGEMPSHNTTIPDPPRRPSFLSLQKPFLLYLPSLKDINSFIRASLITPPLGRTDLTPLYALSK